MNWDTITRAELENLFYLQNKSDSAIAEMFGVPKSQVTYKRNKYGIKQHKALPYCLRRQQGTTYRFMNEKFKRELCQPENIDRISKALTHYAFRNGPVEDMHADGKLSQDDMKTLNKYMVNRLAGVLTAMAQDQWVHLYGLLGPSASMYGGDWDPAEPDMEELDFMYNMLIESMEGL